MGHKTKEMRQREAAVRQGKAATAPVGPFGSRRSAYDTDPASIEEGVAAVLALAPTERGCRLSPHPYRPAIRVEVCTAADMTTITVAISILEIDRLAAALKAAGVHAERRAKGLDAWQEEAMHSGQRSLDMPKGAGKTFMAFKVG